MLPLVRVQPRLPGDHAFGRSACPALPPCLASWGSFSLHCGLESASMQSGGDLELMRLTPSQGSPLSCRLVHRPHFSLLPVGWPSPVTVKAWEHWACSRRLEQARGQFSLQDQPPPPSPGLKGQKHEVYSQIRKLHLMTTVRTVRGLRAVILVPPLRGWVGRSASPIFQVWRPRLGGAVARTGPSLLGRPG